MKTKYAIDNRSKGADEKPSKGEHRKHIERRMCGEEHRTSSILEKAERGSEAERERERADFCHSIVSGLF